MPILVGHAIAYEIANAVEPNAVVVATRVSGEIAGVLSRL
jgi:hypothetical protein